MTGLEERVLGFDPHARDSRINAEDLWTHMREMPGLAFSQEHGGLHMVTRYQDLMDVLLKPELFSSAGGITVPPAAVRSPHVPAEVDPPQHREYRALLTRFLTPQRVREMEPTVRRIVVNLLDGMHGKTHLDFADTFARPLPVYVILELLALPASDGPLLDALVVELHEEVATGVKTGAAGKLTAYIEQMLTERRTRAVDPNENIVSSILLGQVFGRPLTLEEQVSMVRLLLVGGFDTTAITLATAVWWLAQHPEDAARLRADPGLIDKMSEEVVRFASPATYLRREVTQDTELGGTLLRKGDQILICFGAANRDPTKFDCPDEIRIDRSPNPHLGFGAGHHRCVGSFLAKLEMRVALEELLQRYDHFALDPDRPPRLNSGLNQGIISLPMIVPALG